MTKERAAVTIRPPTRESKRERIHLLAVVDRDQITYRPKSAELQVNHTTVKKLARIPGIILGLLLKNPLSVVQPDRIYRACLHLPKTYKEDKRVVATYLKPAMHRLRRELDAIQPDAELSRSVRSAYGKGTIYIPHKSVR